MGESRDFQLPDGSTATTTALWDMVLPCIEWSIQTTSSLCLNMNTYLHVYPFCFLNRKVLNHILPDPMGQLDVLWYQCNPLCMYCT